MAYESTKKIAIVGSGLVGKSWAMLFACSGYEVKIYDVIPEQGRRALQDIQIQLTALYQEGGQRSDLTLTEVIRHIAYTKSLEECVTGVCYIQECVPENRDLKREVWRQVDDIIKDNDVIFGSSTSAILPSLLSDHLKKKSNFMVAHPANPPLFNPMVELVPAPWTDPAAVLRAKILMESIGQVPIILNKEIDGFVQARIQAAIFNVAFQLIKEDYVDVNGLEVAMHEGVGGWYAFLGPFQTEHINSNGFVDFCSKYGDMVERVQSTFPTPELMKRSIPVEAELRERFIPVEAELRERSIPVKAELRERSLPVKAELVERSLPVEDELREGSIPVEDELREGSLPVKAELRERSIPVKAELREGSIPVEAELRERSIPVKVEPTQESNPVQLALALAQWTPLGHLADRCRWRDRRMAALLQLKRRLDDEENMVVLSHGHKQ